MAKIKVSKKVSDSVLAKAKEIQAKAGFQWAPGSYQIQSEPFMKDVKGQQVEHVKVTNLNTDSVFEVRMNGLRPFLLDDNNEVVATTVDKKEGDIVAFVTALLNGVEVTETTESAFRFNGKANENLPEDDCIIWRDKKYPRKSTTVLEFTTLS